MNFKNIWFWLSSILATTSILLAVAIVMYFPLRELYGSTFYNFFVTFEIIIFPFLLKYLVGKRNKVISTEQGGQTNFLWAIIFLMGAVPLLGIALLSLFALLSSPGGCGGGMCGAPIVVFGPPGIIFLIISIIFFFKSKN